MIGRPYDYVSTDCAQGTNQNPERIRPDQCADALNVWAPSGGVEQRPGYVSVVSLSGGTTFSLVVFSARTEDNSGATPVYASPAVGGALDLSNLVADQDRWYLGHTSTFEVARLVLTGQNSNITHFRATYYNGTNWVPLAVTEIGSSVSAISHLNDATAIFLIFVAPSDWATTTVDGDSRYWIRFSITDNDMDAACGVDVDNAGTGSYITPQPLIGMASLAFPQSRRYVTIGASNSVLYYSNAASFGLLDNVLLTISQTPANKNPASFAVVPQHGEAYAAAGGFVTMHKARPSSSDTVRATVEDRDFAIGAGAPWDKNAVAQLADFPTAKFISFFHNRLWVVDEDENLRWSAAAPYHRVWPSLAAQPMMESDNSKTTGMAPLGDAQIIYKNDSIWGATFLQFDAFDVPQYAVRKMVGGVGCVANGSIVEIGGAHVFLSELGVRAFDGVRTYNPAEDTISGTTVDRLRDFWPTITPGRRQYAAAVHWRSKQAYLLSVSVNGSEANNRVVVWDYNNNAWWIWNNIEAQFFLSDEGADDEEKIYFGDASGHVFELGKGDEDNGAAIEAYVITRRLSYKDGSIETTREVEITSRNTTSALDVQVSRNGTPFAHAEAAKTLDLSDRNETVYGDAMGSNFSWIMDRTRSLFTRFTANHVQVKVGTERKGRPFYTSLIRVGFKRTGR